MPSCAPQEVIVTVEFLLGLACDQLKRISWSQFFTKYSYVWVHWPTLTKRIYHSELTNTYIRRIIEAWEANIIKALPNYECVAELPAIIQFQNTTHPDNVYVYCRTFGEYVELRKNFGKEDIGGYIT